VAGRQESPVKNIIGYIDKIPHDCHIKPLMGAAHVFFRKNPTQVEILNDISQELTNFFRILQNHLDEFLDISDGRYADATNSTDKSNSPQDY